MKKIISILLTFVIAFSVSYSVVAANDYREFAVEELKPQWPLRTGGPYYITGLDYYRTRTSASYPNGEHNGIDVGVSGVSVYPVYGGTVQTADLVGSAGYMVELKHNVNGKIYYSRYLHLKPNSIKVKVGQTVTTDTVLGISGGSGSTGSNSDYGKHLHFDIVREGQKNYKNRGYTFDYYINNISELENVRFSGDWNNTNGSKRSCYWKWIVANSKKVNGDYEITHSCSKYETYKNGSTKILGACKVCHKKFDYSKVYTDDVAGLWIAKKNQNINIYNEPYEDATYTSVKSGELEVRGYVNNAYGNKWYVINGDKNKTYYVYENTFKNLYTQDSHYYESNNHRYESGAVIEAPNTNNNGGNNTGLGNSIVGIVDIPSSWDNLSIRTGPSTNYQIVGSMNDGVRCNVYPSKTQNGWYYVEYNGIYGYASGKQINTNNSSTAATPTTPAGISLSTSSVNLDYPNSASKTITVTATGNLPNKYKFELIINSSLNYQWDSSWSGSSINLTVSANQNSVSSSTATIYLKDSSNDSVCASINFNINVTKPVVKENVNVYFELNGGENGPLTRTATQDSSFVVPFQNPYRLGYTFLGWDTDYRSNNPKYKAGDTINIGDGNLILYAVWDETGIPFSLELIEHSVLSDDFEAIEYYVDGDRFWVDDIVFRCDNNIECYWGMIKNSDETFSIMLQIDRIGDITSNELSFDVVNEDGIVLFTDTVLVFENYEKTEDELFLDRNPSGISVYLNGEKLSFDVQPQIINGRTMVPMRKIFEELGTVVGWNNNNQKAVSVKKGDIVSVSIGGQYLTVNGEQKLLDSPPVIISGRTLVPVRAIAESFNCDVEWYDYGASQVVDINMQDTKNNMENKGGLLIGYSEFAPFSFYDDYGNLIGFDTELAKYVCDFWGWDCSFVEIPFDMKFVAINSGEIDCYWNAITKTEERMEYATFTNDYVEYVFETEEAGEWYTNHEYYSVPFKKGDYDTVQLVNIALEEAEKDGTIAYLKYKYGMK